MKTAEIRARFLEFFKGKGHTIVPSSSLVPHNDPSLMFTNSGMVQFKDLFTGRDIRPYSRATSSQKCVRAGGKHNDLENVGYTSRHLTFFEMLGNFSFGDYFKEDAIKYAWEFITEELMLDRNRLCVTIYHTDNEAHSIWKQVSGLPEERIIRISTQDNFWSMGDTGPCGPCTEIFYDQGEHLAGGPPGSPEQDGDRFVEIWNLVFMQYEKLANGDLISLPKKSVDTGMGLERLAGIMQQVFDNFQTDTFRAIIKAISDITGAFSLESTPHKVIADHLRSSSFLIADGVTPSNEGRGYVLRRIIRRAIRYVSALKYEGALMHQLVPVLVSEMGDAYPELAQNKELIQTVLKSEEEMFRRTLDKGLALLAETTAKMEKGSVLSGQVAFKLHDTYGFPIDLTSNILREQDMTVDMEGFEKEMQVQKDRSKESWQGSSEIGIESIWFNIKNRCGETTFLGYDTHDADGVVVALVQDGQEVEVVDNDREFYLVADQTPFYGESGGQLGDVGIIVTPRMTIDVLDTLKPVPELHVHKCRLSSGNITSGASIQLSVNGEYRSGLKRNHTATHLLHAALKRQLSEHLVQKGSLVAHDRLRFDFSYTGGSISRAKLDEIEQAINAQILDDLPVTTEIMDQDDAIKSGATALFGEKYDDYVRVVSVDGQDVTHSKELCGGTHVTRLGEIGLFKILYDTAISAGIRRIEAVTGHESMRLFQQQYNLVKEVSLKLQTPEATILMRIDELNSHNQKLEKEISKLSQRQLLEELSKADKTTIGSLEFFSHAFDKADINAAREAVQQYTSSHDNTVALVFSGATNTLLCAVGKSLHTKIDAKSIMKALAQDLGIKGGGNASLSQGMCPASDFDKAVSVVKPLLTKA